MIYQKIKYTNSSLNFEQVELGERKGLFGSPEPEGKKVGAPKASALSKSAPAITPQGQQPATGKPGQPVGGAVSSLQGVIPNGIGSVETKDYNPGDLYLGGRQSVQDNIAAQGNIVQFQTGIAGANANIASSYNQYLGNVRGAEAQELAAYRQMMASLEQAAANLDQAKLQYMGTQFQTIAGAAKTYVDDQAVIFQNARSESIDKTSFAIAITVSSILMTDEKEPSNLDQNGKVKNNLMPKRVFKLDDVVIREAELDKQGKIVKPAVVSKGIEFAVPDYSQIQISELGFERKNGLVEPDYYYYANGRPDKVGESNVDRDKLVPVKREVTPDGKVIYKDQLGVTLGDDDCSKIYAVADMRASQTQSGCGVVLVKAEKARHMLEHQTLPNIAQDLYDNLEFLVGDDWFRRKLAGILSSFNQDGFLTTIMKLVILFMNMRDGKREEPEYDPLNPPNAANDPKLQDDVINTIKLAYKDQSLKPEQILEIESALTKAQFAADKVNQLKKDLVELSEVNSLASEIATMAKSGGVIDVLEKAKIIKDLNGITVEEAFRQYSELVKLSGNSQATISTTDIESFGKYLTTELTGSGLSKDTIISDQKQKELINTISH